jgi:hypothetical protein
MVSLVVVVDILDSFLGFVIRGFLRARWQGNGGKKQARKRERGRVRMFFIWIQNALCYALFLVKTKKQARCRLLFFVFFVKVYCAMTSVCPARTSVVSRPLASFSLSTVVLNFPAMVCKRIGVLHLVLSVIQPNGVGGSAVRYGADR